MQFALGFLLLLGYLTVLVSLHELGHFLVAKKFGFKIEAYFIGFGPKLWSTTRGETEYGVKAIPGGGYVKIAGMNPYEEVAEADLPRAYGSKPIWQRALVIFCGPGVHFLIAVLIFGSWVFFFGDPSLPPQPVVASVEQTLHGATSPAKLAGLQPGDRIVGIGDLTNPTAEQLSTYVTAHVGQPVDYRIERQGTTLTVTMTPVAERDQNGKVVKGRIGIFLGPTYPGVFKAVTQGGWWLWYSADASVHSVGHVFGPSGVSRLYDSLVHGAPRDLNGGTSVVGVGQQTGALVFQGAWGTLLELMGFITVFIGLVNLVPLPPFDGGHLALLVIEKVRGKAVDYRRVIPVAAVVIGFLVVFVLATVVLDIVQPLPGP
jgi:membrane-associated protease RseP (regulator of RpoE activity)